MIPVLAFANRDPEHFPQPDKLNIERNTQGHLAFGRGIHYCLGAPLARLEAEIALNTMLRRLPNLQIDVDHSELEWRLVPLFHALVSTGHLGCMRSGRGLNPMGDWLGQVEIS